MRFRDRTEAGQTLADQLRGMDMHDPVVLALPRGGVPVAVEIAAALHADVDVFVARKVGLPGHEEFGVAAIAEGSDELVLGEGAASYGLDRHELAELAARQQQELRRRVTAYRGDRKLPELAGRDVILVDDGVATGITAEAALKSLRTQRPRRLILAAGACAADSKRRLARIADDVVCATSPRDFVAVGLWYTDFRQVSDQEVLDLLHKAEPTVRKARR
ncbi:MAG: phosphoribosyltransferase [Catenulispora sp.]|nr:phosphoribosyltransferase [Catenulispora sp.]